MIADFRQYYGVDIPLEGPVEDLARMGILWSQLPGDSRVARVVHPQAAWTTTEYLLWHIEYQLRALAWSLTYNKKRPIPKPKPLETPGELAKAKKRQKEALKLKDRMAIEFGIKD